MGKKGEKKSKNCQISIFGFQCVAMNIKNRLRICAPYLVYSHIWLNLPRDDCDFLRHFPFGLLWWESDFGFLIGSSKVLCALNPKTPSVCDTCGWEFGSWKHSSRISDSSS